MKSTCYLPKIEYDENCAIAIHIVLFCSNRETSNIGFN